MNYVDRMYIPQLSHRLRNFKQVKEHYNFSCFLCGDSKKKSSKARAWFYSGDDGYSFKCYNCNAAMSFYGVFKQLDEELFKKYLFDKRISNEPYVAPVKEVTYASIQSIVTKSSILDDIECILELEETHPSVKYVINRKIPRDKWDKIYFCRYFVQWCNKVKPGTYSEASLKFDHPRLILPFFDENGIPFGFSGRAFGKEEPKYLNVKLDEDMEKIFGLDTVDLTHKFYVTEGQIDSLFLPNAIAAAGSAFNSKTISSNSNNAVIIYDNERRSPEIMKALENTIKAGYNVFIWPDYIQTKDINDLVKAGTPINKVQELIDKNTYSGMLATMKYNQWSRVK